MRSQTLIRVLKHLTATLGQNCSAASLNLTLSKTATIRYSQAKLIFIMPLFKMGGVENLRYNGDIWLNICMQVDWTPYFDNCVKDSCSCDTGGDCECFCTAVAAYAQACNEAGVCVAWRTPEICRKPPLLYNIQYLCIQKRMSYL